MAFTYNPGLLDQDAVSYARFVLNDRLATDALFQDEEIQATLRGFPTNIRGAMGALADRAYLVASSKASDMTNGDRRVAWRDRATAFRELAAQIRSGAHPLAFGGGLGSAQVGNMIRPDLTRYKSD